MNGKRCGKTSVTSEQSPSERDLAIFAAVRVGKRRQRQVAAEFGVSEGRISQIVRKVGNWQGEDVGARDGRRPDDEERLARSLDRAQADQIYEQAMAMFARSCNPIRRTRSGKNGRGEWSEETIAYGPGDIQCLKVAARIIEQHQKHVARQTSRSRTVRGGSVPVAAQDVIEHLVAMRSAAESAGRCPKSADCRRVVEAAVTELLGTTHTLPSAASPTTAPLPQRAAHTVSGGAPRQEPRVSALPGRTLVTRPPLPQRAAHAVSGEAPVDRPLCPSPAAGAEDAKRPAERAHAKHGHEGRVNRCDPPANPAPRGAKVPKVFAPDEPRSEAMEWFDSLDPKQDADLIYALTKMGHEDFERFLLDQKNQNFSGIPLFRRGVARSPHPQARSASEG
jgi:hypothetical protein